MPKVKTKASKKRAPKKEKAKKPTLKELRTAVKAETGKLRARTEHWKGQRSLLADMRKEGLQSSISELGKAKHAADVDRNKVKDVARKAFNATREASEEFCAAAILTAQQNHDATIAEAKASREAVYRTANKGYDVAIEPAVEENKGNVKQYEKDYEDELKTISEHELADLRIIRELISEYTNAILTTEDDIDRANHEEPRNAAAPA